MNWIVFFGWVLYIIILLIFFFLFFFLLSKITKKIRKGRYKKENDIGRPRTEFSRSFGPKSSESRVRMDDPTIQRTNMEASDTTFLSEIQRDIREDREKHQNDSSEEYLTLLKELKEEK